MACRPVTVQRSTCGALLLCVSLCENRLKIEAQIQLCVLSTKKEENLFVYFEIKKALLKNQNCMVWSVLLCKDSTLGLFG